jgi:transcriptional regulator with XRE-family HTH domain
MNSSHQVKQLRLQRAWSQEQLAELAGVSVRTIQRIENGDRPASRRSARLRRYLKLTSPRLAANRRRATKRRWIYVLRKPKRASNARAVFTVH